MSFDKLVYIVKSFMKNQTPEMRQLYALALSILCDQIFEGKV